MKSRGKQNIQAIKRTQVLYRKFPLAKNRRQNQENQHHHCTEERAGAASPAWI